MWTSRKSGPGSRRIDSGGVARTRGILVLLFCAALAPGCGSTQEARVEELSSTGAYPLPVTLAAAEGGRDGYRTQVTFRFEGGTDTELVVELTLAVNPQATLEGGRWQYVGPTGRAHGEVTAESLRFVGGQGEGASVGGVFVLQEGGTPRFRVTLPLTSTGHGYGGS